MHTTHKLNQEIANAFHTIMEKYLKIITIR